MIVCPKCKSQNDERASICIVCGFAFEEDQPAEQDNETLPPSGTDSQPKSEVPTYLAEAILVTIFCCWPLGIVAIVNSAKVNKKLLADDYEGAIESSKNAKTWCWVSFVLGFIVIGIYLEWHCRTFLALSARTFNGV